MDIPTRLMAEKMLGIMCEVQAQPNVSAPYKSVALLRRGVNAATPILHRGGLWFQARDGKIKSLDSSEGPVRCLTGPCCIYCSEVK
jgi:hypothetical protein